MDNQKEITHNFKVGDRVVVCRTKFVIFFGEPRYLYNGDKGTVCDIHSYEKFVGVDFDNKFEGGHNCFNGTAKHGHGFFLPPEDLEFVNKILTIKQWKKK